MRFYIPIKENLFLLLLFSPLFLIWDSASLYPFFEPKVLAFNIAVLFLFAFWATRGKAKSSFSYFDLLVFLWIALSIVSLFFLPHYAIGVSDLLLRLSAFSAFIIIRWFPFIDQNIQKNIAVIFIIFAEVQAIFITGQWFFSLKRGLDFWDNRFLYGTLGFHTFAAAFLGFCLVFSYPLLLETASIKRKLFAAVYIHSSMALLLLQCRAVFLALFSVIVFQTLIFLIDSRFQIRKNRQMLKTALTVFLVAGILATTFFITSGKAGGMWERTKEDIFSSKLAGRKLIWQSAFEMIKEKPIVGYGLGGFYYNYIPFQGKVIFRSEPKNFYPIREMVIWAHNDFIQDFVEIGLCGVILVAIVLYPFFYLILKQKKKIWAKSIANCLLYYFVVSLFDFPLHRPVELVLFMASIAFAGQWLAGEKTNQLKIGKNILFFLFLYGLFLASLSFIDFYWKRIYSQAVDMPKEKVVQKEELLRKSLKYSLKKGQPQAALGALLCEKRDFEKGITLMEEGTQTFRDVYIYENLAKSYLETGDYLKSGENFEKAMAGGINYISDGAMAAKTKMLVGKRDEAWEILKNLYSLSKKNAFLIKVMAGAYIEEKKYDEALKIIAVSKNSTDLEILNLKATALIRKGNIKEAEDTLQRALSINDKYVPVIVNLGVTRMVAGDMAGAKEKFAQALRIDPQNKAASTNLSILEGK